jgi:hypothetical protein
MTNETRSLWKQWKDLLPDGPFRMSIRMWYGKNETMKYRYVNFTKPEQFRNWLLANEAKVYSIVNLEVK